MHIIFTVIVRHATVVKPFQEKRRRRGSGGSKVFIFFTTSQHSRSLSHDQFHHLSIETDVTRLVSFSSGHMRALRTSIQALSSDSLVFKDEQKNHHKTMWIAVQLLSCVWFFATPWTAASQASVSFTIFQDLLKVMSTESVMLSNHLILCHLLSFCLQSFPSSGSLHQIAEVLVLQLLCRSFQWIFRFDFSLGLTDLIFLQSRGSQESSPHLNLKASVLWHSTCFTVQLSHPYMTTGKVVALTMFQSFSPFFYCHYCVPGTVLDPGDTVSNETNKVWVLQSCGSDSHLLVLSVLSARGSKWGELWT